MTNRVPNTFESIPAGEVERIGLLTETIRKSVTTYRDAHARTHGFIGGAKVTVRPDLAQIDKELTVGFFSEPGKVYDAVLRFSPGSGNPLGSDHEPGGQGLALKILLDEKSQQQLVPVFNEHEYFVDEKYYKTFDVLTIGTVSEFFVETVEDYFPFFRAQGEAAKAGQRAGQEGKTPEECNKIAVKVLSDLYFNPPEGKKRLREAALMGRLLANRCKNPFLETYGSWVPYLYGTRAVKYRLSPSETSNPASYEVPAEIVDWNKNDRFIREVMKYELRKNARSFKLSVQFHQPGFPSIEDAVSAWPEDKSPYIEIATVDIPRKMPGDELLPESIWEKASFHPGHASKEHYPIGGIQRARAGGEDYEGIYTVIARTRNINRMAQDKAQAAT